MDEEFNIMKAEIETLKIKNTELEEKLKTYTSNHRHKKYYDMFSHLYYFEKNIKNN